KHSLPMSLIAWGTGMLPKPPSLWGVRGSCVLVPCTLSYPDNVAANDGIVAIWYKDYNNQKTLVYHSAAQEVDAHFRGRAQLLGDPAARNCTLLLRGVTPEDSGPYRFRFEIVNGDRRSMSPSGDNPPPAGQPSAWPGLVPGAPWPPFSPSSLQPAANLSPPTPPNPTGWFPATRAVLGVRPGVGGENAVLIVVDAPQEPSFISLVEPRGGQQAVLLCTVDSFPPSDIALHRGPGHTPLMGGLELRDTGLYICSANNSYGTVSSSLHLDTGGEGSPELSGGLGMVLSCANPSPGHPLTLRPPCSSSGEGPAGSLVLTRVSSADTGSYRCQASGTRGSSASATLSFSVLCECPPAPCGQDTGQDGVQGPRHAGCIQLRTLSCQLCAARGKLGLGATGGLCLHKLQPPLRKAAAGPRPLPAHCH
uniref:Sialic acid binding Ig like lectin 1 n=1 Tax=Calidris pygmaea TaxID=425635 RepID=A0A8C3KS83_9CHAR